MLPEDGKEGDDVSNTFWMICRFLKPGWGKGDGARTGTATAFQHPES